MNKSKISILFMVIIFVLIVGIPFSKAIYKNTTTATKPLSISVWDVELNQTGISNNILLVTGGDTKTYAVRVVSNSEVDTEYSIVVSNIPTGVQVALDEGSFVTPTNGSYTFTDAGEILYSSQTKENTHLLKFKALSSAQIGSNTISVDVVIKQMM